MPAFTGTTRSLLLKGLWFPFAVRVLLLCCVSQSGTAPNAAHGVEIRDASSTLMSVNWDGVGDENSNSTAVTIAANTRWSFRVAIGGAALPSPQNWWAMARICEEV